MQISIRIIYKGNARIMQKGIFPVNSYHFKQDPDQEAARIAHEWWKKIKKEMSYRAKIESVTYNEEIDITALVKKLDNIPLSGLDLPF